MTKIRADYILPLAGNASAAAHFEKIIEAERLGHERASCSTTEAIMVAIALCDRRFLPPGLREAHVRELRERLDANQHAAIERFFRP